MDKLLSFVEENEPMILARGRSQILEMVKELQLILDPSRHLHLTRDVIWRELNRVFEFEMHATPREREERERMQQEKRERERMQQEKRERFRAYLTTGLHTDSKEKP